MKRDDTNKDLRIDWINLIPNHWKKSRFKFVCNLYTGNSLNDSQKLQYESQNLNEIPYISSKDIDAEFKVANYNNGLRIPKDDNSLKKSPKGSFLMVIEGGSSGKKIVFLEQEVCFVNKLCSFNSTENNKFIYYFVQSTHYQDEFKMSISGLIGGVSVTVLKNFKLPLPPIREQKQIVSFLDKKTILIESLVKNTQRKIKLLEEKKISLINEIITKGLDPYVEMIESDHEWIGKIPSHWKKIPLKYISYMKGRIGWKGLKQDEFLDQGDYYLITGHDIKNDKMNWEECYYISKERYEESPEIMLEKGDLLFTKDGTIGKTLYIETLPKPTSLNSHLLVIRPLGKSYNSKFLQYIFKSLQFKMYVEYNKTGTTFYGMSQNSMENFKGYFPTLSEQNEIVSYLDKHTEIINKTILTERKKIRLLKEYNQYLISSSVTGKIRIFEEKI